MERTNGLSTIDSETLTLKQLLRKLREHRIQVVVDVRLTPSSRRPGFSKTPLARVLADASVDYVHERELGNPPEKRAAFHSASSEQGRREMRARLERGGGDALRRLVGRAKLERVAVLCVEAAEVRCHRHVIVEMAREIDPELPILSIW